MTLTAERDTDCGALLAGNLLLIGDVASDRFADVLRTLPPCPDCRCRTVRDAITRLGIDGSSPEFVLVYQSVPDEFPESEVEQLIGHLPLSRVVVVFGAWCESIGRTEQVWPIGWCVPLRHGAVRVRRELDALAEKRSPLPATASRDEAFAIAAEWAFQKPQEHRGAIRRRAFVTGTDLAFAEFVGDALSGFGLDVIRETAVKPLGGLLPPLESLATREPDFDVLCVSLADQWAVEVVRHRRAYLPSSCLIVSSDLATSDDAAALRRAGADYVVSQLRFGEEFAAILRDWAMPGPRDQ